jgi:hypothetical protein
VPLAPRRTDGDGVKFRAITGPFCCFITSGRFAASLRTAVGSSCSPQLCTAARLIRGASPAEDLWQASFCAVEEEAPQTCEWHKGAHSGAISRATSVNSAVIWRPFIAIVNATPRSVQSQIIRAKPLLARLEVRDALDPSRSRLFRGESGRYR